MQDVRVLVLIHILVRERINELLKLLKVLFPIAAGHRLAERITKILGQESSKSHVKNA